MSFTGGVKEICLIQVDTRNENASPYVEATDGK